MIEIKKAPKPNIETRSFATDTLNISIAREQPEPIAIDKIDSTFINDEDNDNSSKEDEFSEEESEISEPESSLPILKETREELFAKIRTRISVSIYFYLNL